MWWDGDTTSWANTFCGNGNINGGVDGIWSRKGIGGLGIREGKGINVENVQGGEKAFKVRRGQKRSRVCKASQQWWTAKLVAREEFVLEESASGQQAGDMHHEGAFEREARTQDRHRGIGISMDKGGAELHHLQPLRTR